MTWGDWMLTAYMAIGCAFADHFLIAMARTSPDRLRRDPAGAVFRATTLAVGWIVVCGVAVVEWWRK